eukprot:m.33187 g.33187  ORF g.33187 m.33187 type:complete len:65 (+) comp12205_c0_seq1:1339-1533(+)
MVRHSRDLQEPGAPTGTERFSGQGGISSDMMFGSSSGSRGGDTKLDRLKQYAGNVVERLQDRYG